MHTLRCGPVLNLRMQGSLQLTLQFVHPVCAFLPEVRRSCRCGNSCLGPLTFHSEAKGQHVKLSAGARRATRNPHSFHHGVMFSSRPLRLDEKVRMRVERCVPAWHGALRLGFTSVPPGTGPVCSFAIPDLTERQGFWATPVPESHCSPRTELTFWLTGSGHLRIRTNSGYEHEEKLDQIDTRKPIWAMIDVYGQTTAVLLLGELFWHNITSLSVSFIHYI